MRRQQESLTRCKKMVSAANGKFSTCSQLLRQAETLKAKISGKSLEATDVTTKEFLNRQGLQSAFKKLLLADVNFALDKKVEFELWNNAFKGHIDALRRQVKDSKGTTKSEIQAKLSCFIDSSIGFYIQLLQEFCDLHGIDSPWRMPLSQLGVDTEPASDSQDAVERRHCLYVCQDCLVHLGDLARYRGDIIQAQAFYVQASNVVPINGQPYNQLAILATAKGDHLAAVFYYCKSITVRNQFPAATSNLQTSFYQLCSQSRSKSPFKSGSFTKDEFIVALLLYFGKLYLVKELDVIPALTEKLLQDFEDVLDEFESTELLYCMGILLFIINTFKTKQNHHSNKDITAEKNFEILSSVLSFAIEWFMCLLRFVQSQLIEFKGNKDIPDVECLSCLKVLTDWLVSNPTILTPLEDSSILVDFWTSYCEFATNIQACVDHEDMSSWPLPEDSLFQGFLPLRKAHRRIDFVTSCPSKVPEIINNARISHLSSLFELLSRHPKLNSYFSKSSNNSSLEYVCLAVKTEADLHAPSTDKEMDIAVRKLFDSLPTLAKPTMHERSKSPFTDTRSLFVAATEQQPTDIQAEKPKPITNGNPKVTTSGPLPSYSLFDSTWSIQLNRKQGALNDNTEGNKAIEPLNDQPSPGSLLFPSSQDAEASLNAQMSDFESKPLPILNPATLNLHPSSSHQPRPPPVTNEIYSTFQDPCIITQVPYHPPEQHRLPMSTPSASRFVPSHPNNISNGFGPIGQSPTNPFRSSPPKMNPYPVPPLPPADGWRFQNGGVPNTTPPAQPGQSIWGANFGFGPTAMSPLEQLLEEQRVRGQPPS